VYSALAGAVLIWGFNSGQSHAAATQAVQATLKDASGTVFGTVKLTEQGETVSGVVDVKGLPPGGHGMHIHEVGKCDGPDFKTAGAHLNPDHKQHGLENPLGPHQGDVPQLTVGPDGRGHAIFTAKTTMAAIMDADGSSFVIHAAPDDNKTDPSGNSGARILCGVLTPTA
jgi:Cu-Zn family superoxide dismutase